MRKTIAPALAAVVAIAVAAPAQADEPAFGDVYTTDLLPQGKSEVEEQLAWKSHKAHGSFDLLESRTELSYGLSNSFQISGKLTYDWTRARQNAVDGTTTPPEPFSAYFPAPNSTFERGHLVGGSVEGIYRIQSPYLHPIGLAVYLEQTFGDRFIETEARLIAQKNFDDDRLVLAANLKWAPEIRFLPPDPFAAAGTIEARSNTNIETDLNFTVGASYRFASNWSAGWEFANEREINGWNVFDKDQWMGSAYYTGPSLHYGGKHMFFTLAASEQLPWAKDYMNQPVIYRGRDYDVDFEKFRVRLKLGYYF